MFSMSNIYNLKTNCFGLFRPEKNISYIKALELNKYYFLERQIWLISLLTKIFIFLGQVITLFNSPVVLEKQFRTLIYFSKEIWHV